MTMRRPDDRPTGPVGERMILALIFVRAFWKQGLYKEIRLSDFHEYFKLFLQTLTSDWEIEDSLGFKWNKAKQRFDDLDSILSVFEDKDILLTYFYLGEEALDIKIRADLAMNSFFHEKADLLSEEFHSRRELAEKIALRYKNRHRVGL